ncbi:MAG: J domain-containing protein [Bacteroidetes bacterium]|nr:J domain-containing protein [Bacteroidota bacterium]
MKPFKIFHTITGYFFGGPIGGLLGFYSEDIVNNLKTEYVREDSGAYLLLLGGSLIKTPGANKALKTEFLQDYFLAIFGEEKGRIKMKFLQKVLNEKYDFASIANDAGREYDSKSKLQILHFLFRMASCEQPFMREDLRKISIIANNLGVHIADYNILKKRFVADLEPDHAQLYRILQLNGGEEFHIITKQYRKLVLLYHPDRLPNLSEREAKIARVHFEEIKSAYDMLKKIYKQ